MTIREYVKRRFLNLALIYVLAFAAVEVLRTCIQYWPSSFASIPWVLVVAAMPVFWLGVAWFLLQFIRTPCPRCSNPLGSVALAVVIGHKRIQRCSLCRVSIDEPVVPVPPP